MKGREEFYPLFYQISNSNSLPYAGALGEQLFATLTKLQYNLKISGFSVS